MTEEQGYPFVFLGAAPVDWFELEDDLFSYELRFAQAPSSDERRSIAEAWERALDQDAVELVTAFVWADRWALVRVRPAGWDRASVTEMARAVERALTAVHAACPLDQVILAEALESESAWDQFSLEARPDPAAGPAWPIALPKTGRGNRFQAECAEDPAFERAREEARAELSRSATTMVDDAPAGDDADDSGEGEGREDESDSDSDSDSADDSDKPVVKEGDVRVGPTQTRPSPPEVTSDQRKLFGKRAAMKVAANGRVYGIAKPGRKPPQIAWVEDDELVFAEGGAVPEAYSPSLAAREDCGAALFAFDDDSVWEVDFTERRARELFKLDTSVSAVAYGPEGRIIVMAGSSIDVYKREGEGAALEQRWGVNAYQLCAFAGGRLLCVAVYEDGEDGVTMLGLDGPKLRRLARIETLVSELSAWGGHPMVERSQDPSGDGFCIQGWEELLAKLDSDPESFPEVPVYTEEKEQDDDGDEESGDADGESDDDESGDERDSSDESGDDADDDQDDSDDDDDREVAPAKKPEEFAAPPRPGHIGAIYLGATAPFETDDDDPSIPRDVKRAFGNSSDIEVTPDGSLYYGWKKEGRRQLRYAWFESGRLTETLLVVRSSGSLSTVRWDRRQAVVTSDGDSKLWSISFTSREATLVYNFSKEENEDEVYWIEVAAEGRVFAATSTELWVFSTARDEPVLEMRGELDVRQLEAVKEGRVLALHVNGEEPLRIWGLYPGEVRELARLSIHPDDIMARDGGVIVEGSQASRGYYELVNLEEAWQVARNDSAGTEYPRVELTRAASKDDEDEDEDEGGDEDEDESDGEDESDEEDEGDGDGGDDDDDEEEDDD